VRARTVAALCLPVLWNGVILPHLRLGLRGRTLANAAFATGYAAIFGAAGQLTPSSSRHALGRDPLHTRRIRPQARRNDKTRRHPATTGLRCGTALAATVFAGYAALLAVPSTRTRLAELSTRSPEAGLAEWAGVHIPLGTVYTEELIFRGTLDPLLEDTTGRFGTWLGPVAFGLWHIAPARAADDSVPTTVIATALGGLALGWLRRRTDSTLTPALLHLALNTGGAIAPHLASRMTTSSTRSWRCSLWTYSNTMSWWTTVRRLR
jgi:membrane protease YdiL (CAAX protease family)